MSEPMTATTAPPRPRTLRALLATAASLAFPGFGEGIAGHYRAMVVWALAGSLVALGCVLSVWIVPLLFAVRIAAASSAFRSVRAAARAGARTDWIGGFAAVGITTLLLLGIRTQALEAFHLPSSSMVPTIDVGDSVLTNKLARRSIARGDLIVFRHPCAPQRDYLKRAIALGGDTVEVRCHVVYVNGAPLASQLVQGEGCKYDDRDEADGRWFSRPCSEYAETAGTHHYHILHDADRAVNDSSGRADSKDFPQLDGPRQPPSCASSAMDGTPVGEQLGTIVQKRQAGPCEPQLHYVVPAGHVFTLGDNRANSNDSRWWGSVPLDLVKAKVVGIWSSDGRSGASFDRFGDIE